jgi:hypothetical protein
VSKAFPLPAPPVSTVVLQEQSVLQEKRKFKQSNELNGGPKSSNKATTNR